MKHTLKLLFSISLLISAPSLRSAVADITGDTGSAQSGSVTISGGTSGAVFDSTTSTITQKFNNVVLPYTSSTVGQVIMGDAPVLHGYPASNSNLFVGAYSGNFTLASAACVGCGVSTLSSLTSGNNNTAVGEGSLTTLTSGSDNVAVGASSGLNMTTGQSNVIIGSNAGTNYTGSEASNILIGSFVPGVAGENAVTRIGGAVDNQSAVYIDGIYGNTIDFLSALPVFIDENAKLGTILSSAEFKKNIQPVGDISELILQLQPVSFVAKSDPREAIQFGLVAEDVYKTFPALVVLRNGKPYSVRYHELPVLLLNELQKKSALIDNLQKQVNTLIKRIEKLEAHSKR